MVKIGFWKGNSEGFITLKGDYRLRKLATYADGLTIDMGYADKPNAYLDGKVIGLDRNVRQFPNNYLTAVVCDVRAFSFASESVDTIVAGEIIEHLENPIKFLTDCYNILRKRGRLVLSTPNPYYPPYIFLNWLLIRKYYYAKEHIYAFTPRLMLRLCERVGFEVEEVASGGLVLPFTKWTIPFFRPICYQMVYVCRKF